MCRPRKSIARFCLVATLILCLLFQPWLRLQVLAAGQSGKAAEQEVLSAAQNGDVDRARALLSSNKKLAKIKNSEGLTPLHLGALAGSFEVVRLLLEYDADAKAKTKFDVTPLHYAAQSGQAEIVNLLLSRKANVEAKDKNGQRPSDYAARGGNEDLAFALRKKEEAQARQRRIRNTLIAIGISVAAALVIYYALRKDKDDETKTKEEREKAAQEAEAKKAEIDRDEAEKRRLEQEEAEARREIDAPISVASKRPTDERATEPSPVLPELVSDSVEYRRLEPIPFLPYPMLDPATGEPVSSDTQIQVPGIGSLTAGQYYDELNQIEASLNSLGFTTKEGPDELVITEPKQDYTPAIDEGQVEEIGLAKPANWTRGLLAFNSFSTSNLWPTMSDGVLPLPFAWAPEPVMSTWLKPLSLKKSLFLGNKRFLGVSVTGSLSATAGLDQAQIVSSLDISVFLPTGGRVQFANLSNTLNRSFDNGLAQAKAARGDLTQKLNLLSQPITIPNLPKPSVEGQGILFGKDTKIPGPIIPYMIGPVPMQMAFNFYAGTKTTYSYGASLHGLTGVVSPEVTAGIEIETGPPAPKKMKIVDGRIIGRVEVIKGQLDLSGTVTTNPPQKLSVRADREFSYLNGDIKAVLTFPVVTWTGPTVNEIKRMPKETLATAKCAINNLKSVWGGNSSRCGASAKSIIKKVPRLTYKIKTMRASIYAFNGPPSQRKNIFEKTFSEELPATPSQPRPAAHVEARTAPVAPSQRYIADLAIISGRKDSLACPAGFDKDSLDLNRGVGGDFIYLCIKQTTNPAEAVTDIRIIEGQNTAAPSGYTRLPTDLNTRAQGAYIYLAFTKDKKFSPLKGVFLWSRRAYLDSLNNSFGRNYPTQEALIRQGYDKCFTNLNKDTGKPDTEIYLFKIR